MRDWVTGFRSRFNREVAGHPVDWGSKLYLSLFGRSVPDEELKSALKALRRDRGRFLTPVDVESTVFLPEAAVIYYLTSTEFDQPTGEDDFKFCGGPPGGHEWLAVKLSFSVNQRTSLVSNDYHAIEIGLI